MKHVHPHDWPSLTFMVFHVASTSGSAGTQAIKLCSSYAQAMLKLCSSYAGYVSRTSTIFAANSGLASESIAGVPSVGMLSDMHMIAPHMTEHAKYIEISSLPLVVTRHRPSPTHTWCVFLSGVCHRFLVGRDSNHVLSANWHVLGSKLAAWPWLIAAPGSQ